MPTGRRSGSTTTRPVTPTCFGLGGGLGHRPLRADGVGLLDHLAQVALDPPDLLGLGGDGQEPVREPEPAQLGHGDGHGGRVTVSMLAETMGTASSTPPVKQERVETCRWERMLDRRGTSRTSSKVRARREGSAMGPRLGGATGYPG